MIPEVLKSITGTVVRRALTSVFVWLAAQGWVTEQDADAVIVWIGATAAVLVWSLVMKVREKIKLDQALRLPAGTSYEALRDALQGNN